MIPFDDREVAAEALARRLKGPPGESAAGRSGPTWETCDPAVRGPDRRDHRRQCADLVADPGAIVTGPVVIDSRQAGPGSLFAALPGTRADGHDFAAAAVAAGAAAVLATRPVGVPALLVADVPAALAALARAVVDRLPEPDHRRDHRIRRARPPPRTWPPS